LILSILVKRPTSTQHFCADKTYDGWDVHLFVQQRGYIPHVKHRRRRNEPRQDPCPIPGKYRYPARRWVVERTPSWLVKRRSICIRWCKKPANWLALIQLTCADIVFNLAPYG
jgi:putative transposase